MINAGKYNHKISIYSTEVVEDGHGFQKEVPKIILTTYANIKTTRGSTLIRNGTDFERAYTNFTIRYPKTEINRDMMVKFGNKDYTIEYLNNIDEENVELEIQAKEVTH